MDNEGNTINEAMKAVVGYIKDDLQGNPVFDDLVDALIRNDSSACRIQQQYLESSVGDYNHQTIELLYTELWESMEQAAMRYVIAKLMVEYYD